MNAFCMQQISKTDIINSLIIKNSYQTYLEIGLDRANNFRAIDIASKESVDPAEGQYKHAKPTHRMTSDEFFNQIGSDVKWDIIFIDGLHHADQVYRDIQNALNHINKGGCVVCHDLSPTSYEMQLVPRQTSTWTGDCWKAWVQVRSERSDLYMIAYDTDHGTGVITKSDGEGNPLDLKGFEIEYEPFSKNKKEWLNLIPLAEVPQHFPGAYLAKRYRRRKPSILPLIVGVITLMVLIAQFIVLPKSFFFGIVTLVSAIALIALYLQEQKRFQQENIIDR
jgi:hypothetical protein